MAASPSRKTRGRASSLLVFRQVTTALGQKILKHVIRYVSPGGLSGGGIEREMDAAIDAAAGDLVCQSREAAVIPGYTAGEIYLELNVVAPIQ